jgi:hypothetical protein
MLPNTYIRSVLAKEPIKTYTEEELKAKSIDKLHQIEDYQIKALKLLAGEQVLHNLSIIDKLTDKGNKS